jgi:hypothetical protein
MLHVARSMLHAARRRWPLHCPPTRHTPRSLEDAHAAAGSAALLQRARVQPARVAPRHAVRACVRRCAGSRSCCSCMCCRTRLRRSTRIRSRRRPPARRLFWRFHACQAHAALPSVAERACVLLLGSLALGVLPVQTCTRDRGAGLLGAAGA